MVSIASISQIPTDSKDGMVLVFLLILISLILGFYGKWSLEKIKKEQEYKKIISEKEQLAKEERSKRLSDSFKGIGQIVENNTKAIRENSKTQGESVIVLEGLCTKIDDIGFNVEKNKESISRIARDIGLETKVRRSYDTIS